MRHVNHVKTTAPVVPDEWLDATAKATSFAIDVTGHGHVAVKMGPGFAAEAGTAMYVPALGNIEIDTSVMLPGVKPSDVYFNDDLFRSRHPLLIGALLHEAGHAVASTWTPFDLHVDPRFSNRQIQILVMLEESRVEKIIAERKPRLAAQYLPSIVFDLLLRDGIDIPSDRFGASMIAALILGRIETGVLKASDVRPFRNLVLDVLDEDTLDALRPLWVEYQDLTFRDEDGEAELPADAMLSIADRWMLALGYEPTALDAERREDAAERGAGEPGEPDGKPGKPGKPDKADKAGEPGAGGGAPEDDEAAESDDEDGKGSGDAEGDEGDDEAPEDGEGGGKGAADDDAAGAPEDGAGGDGDGAPDLTDRMREALDAAKHAEGMRAATRVGDLKRAIREAERKAEAGRRAKNADVAEAAFGKDKARMTREGVSVSLGMRSKISWRKPTDSERAGASMFARLLDKIMTQDKRVTKVAQAAPGGRLRPRAAVQKVAEKHAGKLVSEQKPWQVKRRALTDKPMLRVGVLLDVSGSMSSEARAAATASYVIGNAVNRQGGLFTEVAFGAGVHGITKPGVKIDAVAQIEPRDGTENFRMGWRALDSVLDLVSGSGLRVVFFLTDGHFVNDADAAEADVIIPWLHSQGVLVLHVDCSGSSAIMRHEKRGLNLRHRNPVPVIDLPAAATPEQIADVMGGALIRAVKDFQMKGNAA